MKRLRLILAIATIGLFQFGTGVPEARACLLKAIGEFLGSIVDAVSNFISDVVDTVSNFVDDLVDFFWPGDDKQQVDIADQFDQYMTNPNVQSVAYVQTSRDGNQQMMTVQMRDGQTDDKGHSLSSSVTTDDRTVFYTALPTVTWDDPADPPLLQTAEPPPFPIEVRLLGWNERLPSKMLEYVPPYDHPGGSYSDGATDYGVPIIGTVTAGHSPGYRYYLGTMLVSPSGKVYKYVDLEAGKPANRRVDNFMVYVGWNYLGFSWEWYFDYFDGYEQNDGGHPAQEFKRKPIVLDELGLWYVYNYNVSTEKDRWIYAQVGIDYNYDTIEKYDGTVPTEVTNAGYRLLSIVKGGKLHMARKGILVIPPPNSNPNKPTATITASQATTTVGQSVTITATFAADSTSGDVLTKTAIESPVGTIVPGGDVLPVNSKQYAFTPTAAGTYVFHAMCSSDKFGNYESYASVSVDVSKGLQATPTLTASPSTIVMGGTISGTTSTLIASGGAGNGAYIYEQVSGPGVLSGNNLSSLAPGVCSVRCMRVGDGSYLDSSWSEPVTVNVTPRIDGVSIDDDSKKIQVTSLDPSIEFGSTARFQIQLTDISSVTIDEDGSRLGVFHSGDSPIVTFTPRAGGFRTFNFTSDEFAGKDGTLRVNQVGATEIHVTNPNGVITTITPDAAEAYPVTVPGSYLVEAVWSDGLTTTGTTTLGTSTIPAIAKMASQKSAAASAIVAVRPRIDTFAINPTIPETPICAPMLQVQSSIPLGPFDELVVPAELTASWMNSTGRITGPGLNPQTSESGQTNFTLSHTDLSGDGTVVYSMEGSVHKYVARWAGAGSTAATLLVSRNNSDFTDYQRCPENGESLPLPAGWYKLRLTNPAGSTESVSLRSAGDRQDSPVTAYIQPKVPLIVSSSDETKGAVSASKNYIFGTTAADVIATASVGNQFTHFSGDIIGATSIIERVSGASSGKIAGLPMTLPRRVVANFDAKTYAVTGAVADSGAAGAALPSSAISITGSNYTDFFGNAGFRHGTTVTAQFISPQTARGNARYELLRWFDNGVLANATNPFTLNLSGAAAAAHDLRAEVQVRKFSLTAAAIADGPGSVRVWARDGSFVDVATTGSVSVSPAPGPYEIDSTVTVSTSIPTSQGASGVEKLTWSGDFVTSNSLIPTSAVVLMAAPTSVTAVFHVKKEQSVTWTANPGVALVGDVIPLAAVATSGLPVEVTFDAGASNCSYNAVTRQLTITNPGTIAIRLWQAGNGTYLPSKPQVYTIQGQQKFILKVTPTVKANSNKEGDVNEQSTQQIVPTR